MLSIFAFNILFYLNANQNSANEVCKLNRIQQDKENFIQKLEELNLVSFTESGWYINVDDLLNKLEVKYGGVKQEIENRAKTLDTTTMLGPDFYQNLYEQKIQRNLADSNSKAFLSKLAGNENIAPASFSSLNEAKQIVSVYYRYFANTKCCLHHQITNNAFFEARQSVANISCSVSNKPDRRHNLEMTSSMIKMNEFTSPGTTQTDSQNRRREVTTLDEAKLDTACQQLKTIDNKREEILCRAKTVCLSRQSPATVPGTRIGSVIHNRLSERQNEDICPTSIVDYCVSDFYAGSGSSDIILRKQNSFFGLLRPSCNYSRYTHILPAFTNERHGNQFYDGECNLNWNKYKEAYRRGLTEDFGLDSNFERRCNSLQRRPPSSDSQGIGG